MTDESTRRLERDTFSSGNNLEDLARRYRREGRDEEATSLEYDINQRDFDEYHERVFSPTGELFRLGSAHYGKKLIYGAIGGAALTFGMLIYPIAKAPEIADSLPAQGIEIFAQLSIAAGLGCIIKATYHWALEKWNDYQSEKIHRKAGFPESYKQIWDRLAEIGNKEKN